MAIQLLGYPTTLGLPNPAQRHGPEAMRAAGLVQRLQELGSAVEDLGDLPLPSGSRSDAPAERIRKTVEAARLQADFWLKAHKPGKMMLTVGGDHSTSLGTIWALARMGHSFDVIWIDAHGDFNIVETSPSGNPHGMVLALACGLMPDQMPKVLDPSCIRQWGVRDLDPGEKLLLERERVEVLSPDQVRHERERIVNRLKPNVLISFDIDSVEPDEAPGTLVKVKGGFHRSEALELIAYIARHRQLLALDLVEFHPEHDRNDLTLNLALDVVRTAVSGQVNRRSNTGLSAAAGA